jgi:hypothetical protein
MNRTIAAPDSLPLSFGPMPPRAGAHRLAGPLLAAALLAAAGSPVQAAGAVKFAATYSIVIHGITIGHARSEVDINGASYTAAIAGSVSGILKLFSDASTKLVGAGRIDGDRILPTSYDMVTHDGGGETSVSMAAKDGTVTSFTALPEPKPAPDRIPLTPADQRNTVDPLSAFLVPLAPPATLDGPTACNRTINVFDGWQRYDLQLSYRSTRHIKGRGDAYVGDAFVCNARYVPVAGHRQNAKSVNEMAGNTRLQVWLAPVVGTSMLAPYKIVIGDTKLGDLIVTATRFVSKPADDRASAN